jgi:predicted RNA-binding protein with PUA-like domain
MSGQFWLFKTEPGEFSIEDLASEPDRTSRWDGIRNYQVRNLLRDNVQLGDKVKVLIYHSSCKVPAVVGVAKIVKAAYPDPAQFDRRSPCFDSRATRIDPRWFCVDPCLEDRFQYPVTLRHIRETPVLKSMVLLKQARLSVQPV